MAKDTVILERQFAPKGTVIIEQGDSAFFAYLIQSGSVVVYKEKDGETVELAKLETGEICGEMALINEGTRSASVKTLEDCNLILISRTTFEEKLQKSDPTIQAMMKMLINRITGINDKAFKA